MAEENGKTGIDEAKQIASGAVDAGKAAAKAAAGDAVGAVKDGVKAIKKLIVPIIIIISVVVLGIAASITMLANTPAMIWNSITSSYQDWTLKKAIDEIDEAFTNNAKDVSNDIISEINKTLPSNKFGDLRDAFFAGENENGQKVYMDPNGKYSFCIAYAKNSTDDICFCYTDLTNGDYYEYTITGVNSLDTKNISYTQIINGYIQHRQEEKQAKIAKKTGIAGNSESVEANGTSFYQYNGSQFNLGQTISGTSTHYCACSICCGQNSKGDKSTTASGVKVYNGMTDSYIVACNWLPQGSVISIDGVYYTVADTGGSDFNNVGRVDIFTPEGHEAAINAGRNNINIKIIRLGWASEKGMVYNYNESTVALSNTIVDNSNDEDNTTDTNIDGEADSDSDFNELYQNLNDDDSDKQLGLIGTYKLKKYLEKGKSKDILFHVSYSAGKEKKDIEKLNGNLDVANDTDAAKSDLTPVKDDYEPHFYKFSINISSTEDEVKVDSEDEMDDSDDTLDSNGTSKTDTSTDDDTYSGIVVKLFDLKSDSIKQINSRENFSKIIMEAALKTNDEAAEKIPSDMSFSPSTMVAEQLLNGNEVKIQLSGNGALANTLDDASIRKLVVQRVQKIYEKYSTVSESSYMGLDTNAFNKLYGNTMNKTYPGDPGMMMVKLFDTPFKSSKSSIYSFLFGANKLYQSDQYANIMKGQGRYYTLDDSKHQIEAGDLIFFKANIGNSESGKSTAVDNASVGVVTKTNASQLTVIIYHYNTNGSTTGDYKFALGYDYIDFQQQSPYEISQITISENQFDNNYKMISGYAKPNYELYAKDYNANYASSVTNNIIASTIISDNSGSGVLGYPTDTKKTSATYPEYSSGKYHNGVDFPVATGSNVYAAEAGTVILTKNLNRSYGHYIVIKHNENLYTLYAHNSTILVKEGQKVVKGELIAKSGSTGNSTGPHCHFSVLTSWTPQHYVNPMNYLQ